MLNMRKIELELISDANIYLLLEKCTRSGVSYISKRYRKASNKYLKFYDQKRDSKNITYIDAINLHGYAMFEFLPAGIFKWIHTEELDLNKYNKNSLKGFDL